MRAVALVVAFSAALVPTATEASPDTDARSGVIPGSYIVTLQPDASTGDVIAAARRHEPVAVHARFRSVLNGFAASMSPAAVRRMRSRPEVLDVEPDRVVSAAATQGSPTWGLDRIDQRSLPLSGDYRYNTTGLGVTAYVIDTGVRATHVELAGRVAPGLDLVGGTITPECFDHGTHVAGTVVGTTYGVAKAATVVPVRVLDCKGKGSLSDLVEGLDWITANHTPDNPAVANLSLGFSGSSSTVTTALEQTTAAGIALVVAAGNSNADACAYSPAQFAAALTVGATTDADARAYYSNYGTCVDLFAPGSRVTSSVSSSDTTIDTFSGTSMATPHVTGVVARYLQTHPKASPAQVHAALVSGASTGVGSAGSGSPDALLFADGLPHDTTPPSIASVTLSPATVDATTASRSVTATLRIIDDLSGATAPSVGFRRGDDRTASVLTQRINGTGSDGLYRATVTIPRGAAPGSWVPAVPALEDLEGNRVENPTTGATRLTVADASQQPATADTTAPAVRLTAPRAGFRLRGRIPLAWRTTDAGSGVRSVSVRWRRAGPGGRFGRWRRPPAWQNTTESRAALRRTAAGYTYCFSARARDRAGNVSRWSPQRCVARPLDDRALVRSPGWTARRGAGYYGTTYRATSQRGARLSIGPVRARRLALVATSCRRCGSLTVFLGGRNVGKVDLRRTRLRRKTVIPLSSFASPRRGRLVVRVTSSGRRVEIDGVGILAR